MKKYKQCENCILDTNDDPFISFDANGVCNHCKKYEEEARKHVFTGSEAQEKLNAIINKIKREGAGKKYDTILGVSGGVDSTYLAFLAKQYGSRVLLFHFDNGWDSELSVKNIESMASKLGYDLSTYVVDWKEFRDVQLAYIKANVVDIEAITDHAAKIATIRLAKKFKINNILIGTNVVSESVLPANWIFSKRDWRNLRDIQRQYGSIKLSTLPVSSIWEDFYIYRISKINFFSLLDLVPYVKADVKKLITEKLGWKDYGGKHYESIWTRFYQGYILPKKFGIDKRKAHYSNLICSGQMSKSEALEEMKLPIYDAQKLREDKEYVYKKLGFTEKEFDEYLQHPRREHKEFDYIKPIEERYPYLKFLKTIYGKIKK